MNELRRPPLPADLYITNELRSRAPKRTDYLREKLALQDLARQMIDSPADILPRLVDLAMELTGSGSGGVSLYEAEPAPGVFRWRYLRGGLARFNDATTPRDFSPCGICLDRSEPTLSRRPERVYGWIADANIEVPEVLLVPLYAAADKPLGTLWIVSDREGHFDSGHARVLGELAGFVGIALRMLGTEQLLQESLYEQELLAKEMSHRVKNLFMVATGMINASARSASTPAEMATVLTGRLNALAHANALARRSFGGTGTSGDGTDLAEVIRRVLSPHVADEGAGAPVRFHVAGPPVLLGEHATNGFALAFHEFATNAAKYGSLSNDEGVVRVSWEQIEERLDLIWQESGGPLVDGAPAKNGFGSALAQRTIVQQFAGSLARDWRPEGLFVNMSVQMARLHR